MHEGLSILNIHYCVFTFDCNFPCIGTALDAYGCYTLLQCEHRNGNKLELLSKYDKGKMSGCPYVSHLLAGLKLALQFNQWAGKLRLEYLLDSCVQCSFGTLPAYLTPGHSGKYSPFRKLNIIGNSACPTNISDTCCKGNCSLLLLSQSILMEKQQADWTFHGVDLLPQSLEKRNTADAKGPSCH